MNSPSLPYIVVIGAGLSGLTTAYRLNTYGFNVDVYEARNRTGGRVLTASIDNQLIELGGQNILDGGDAHYILKLIKELQLETVSAHSVLDLHYLEQDHLIPINTVLKQRNFPQKQIREKLLNLQKTSKNMQEVLNALFDKNDILYKACHVMLAGYEGESPEKLSTYYIETLFHILSGGLSSSHQSHTSEKTFIDHLMIKKGNEQLTHKLAQNLEGKIHLNHTLKSIHKHNNHYVLDFQNGLQMKTPLVVFSIPCAAYSNLSIAENVIPRKTLHSMHLLKCGNTAKIVFPIESYKNFEGAFSNGRCVSFMNRSSSMMNLYYISPYANFTKESIVKTFKNESSLINKAYQTANSALPVMAKDESFQSYSTPVGYAWGHHPFSQGSYSYIQSGGEELYTSFTEISNEKVKTLFAPIERSLFFAGEHTSTLLEVSGTMEAAVESGERTARLIKNLNC